MASSTVEMLAKASKVGATIIGDNVEDITPDEFDTGLPAVNTILSGDPFGGLLSGTTVIAGESRSFKTLLSLLCISGYMKKYPDSACLFFDSEYGAMPEYWKVVGIDTNRVLHIPVGTIEELRIELSRALKQIRENKLKAVLFLDSLGLLGTENDIVNSETGEIKADVGALAKQIKGMFKAVNVPVNREKIPFVIVNHVYQQVGQMYAKKAMSGGQGPMLAANSVIFVSAATVKSGSEEVGKRFTMKVEKGRKVKPNSKIYLEIPYSGKISKMTGVFDMLVDVGLITSSPGGWWKLPDGSKAQRSKVTDDQLMALLEEHREDIRKHFIYESTF